MNVILAGVDEEHLTSARSDPRFGEPSAEVSFGTMLWEEPPTFPRDVPIYFYAVTRGNSESIPAATWRGRFTRDRRREQFASLDELDATRPQTTLDRRDHVDPDWAGYLRIRAKVSCCVNRALLSSSHAEGMQRNDVYRRPSDHGSHP